jgi:putative oxidoreductase
MKMIHFQEMQTQFYSFMGMGSKFTLIIAIIVEVLCALFIVLGLFTRLAVIPLIILMLVVVFGAHAGKPMAESEMSLMYLAAFVTLLFCGPGRISIDGMINK